MSNNKVGISIVICTYNGKKRLPDVLDAIARQKATKLYDFELIIVDNLSTDETLSFCRDYLSKLEVSFSWKTVLELNPGLNHARLKGLKEAQYEFVLFCDDDNILAENYIDTASNILTTNLEIGALGGFGIPVFEGEKPEWFDNYSYSFAVGAQAAEDGIMTSYPAELYGAGTFFRKAPLLELFNKSFKTIMSDRKGNTLASGGDVEWCYLIQLLGYKLYYDHRLVFWHQMPDQRMRWDYYLRLKEGISSGVCRLLSYHCIFKNPKSGLLLFSTLWLKQLLFSTLIYFKLKFLQFLNQKEPTSKELLSAVIWKAKTNAYWRDGFTAFNHFKQLKKHIH